jgi:hypothetical protein
MDLERDRLAGGLFHLLKAALEGERQRPIEDCPIYRAFEQQWDEYYRAVSEAKKIEWLAAIDEYERRLDQP